jgi:regulator of replication initiation timing
MVDLDAMDADPWPTWPVDKNELRGLVDEIERLREMRDDWRAAMTENHDLWNENERLRARIEALEGEIRETAEASND